MGRKILAFLLAAGLILQPVGSASYAAEIYPTVSEEQIESEDTAVQENTGEKQQVQEEAQEPEDAEDSGAQETPQEVFSETENQTESSLLFQRK